MNFNFNTFHTTVKNIEAWLQNEYTHIRTGRASISFLDPVRVEAYGDMSPLSSVASVGVEDAKTLRITPWDTSLMRAIEKGIITSDLGISTTVDDKGIRVIFPDLTGERRQQLVKLAKTKVEEAKVQLRQARADANDSIAKEKKEGSMTEDEVTRGKKDLDTHMAEATQILESVFNKKETEISKV